MGFNGLNGGWKQQWQDISYDCNGYMTNIIDGSWSAMPRMIIPEALGNGIDGPFSYQTWWFSVIFIGQKYIGILIKAHQVAPISWWLKHHFSQPFPGGVAAIPGLRTLRWPSRRGRASNSRQRLAEGPCNGSCNGGVKTKRWWHRWFFLGYPCWSQVMDYSRHKLTTPAFFLRVGLERTG